MLGLPRPPGENPPTSAASSSVAAQRLGVPEPSHKAETLLQDAHWLTLIWKESIALSEAQTFLSEGRNTQLR